MLLTSGRRSTCQADARIEVERVVDGGARGYLAMIRSVDGFVLGVDQGRMAGGPGR
jgi:hypothetical protein